VGAAARVLAHPGVSEADKERLRGLVAASDPVMLFTGIRVAQEELGRRVDRRGLNGELEKPFTIDLQRFTASLKTAWQAGETRPTHRRPYRRTKPYPKRPSIYEPYEAQIRAWLEAEPAIPAATVLQRLMGADPLRFRTKSLRMVQRVVKAWRAEVMGRIILDGDWIKRVPTSPDALEAEVTHSTTMPGNILR
jgi:hypothetical protein